MEENWIPKALWKKSYEHCKIIYELHRQRKERVLFTPNSFSLREMDVFV